MNMNYHISTGKLILASASPRRRDLLTQAGLQFTVVPSTINEEIWNLKNPEDHARILARAKAQEVSGRNPNDWVIGADTVVVINGDVLGKPVDESEAWTMLQILSGNTHRVITGYCICCKILDKTFTETVTTKVQFKKLTNQEIDWYVGTREPYDKAGGYAVQGMGTVFVKRIEGSYTNVVGLPVCEVVECLVRKGVVQR